MVATATEVQKMKQDAVVRLLDIDYTNIGGSVIYLTDSVRDPSTVVQFNGNTYTGRRFKLTGLQKQLGGASGRPTLIIDNTDRFWWSLINNYDRLRRARVIYRELYAQHLDGGSDPNTAERIELHELEIWQMSQIGRQEVAFKLATDLDHEQTMFGEQMLRNVCRRKYRVPTATTDQFIDVNSNPELVDCPYTGSTYRKKDGTAAADWSEDDCGQRLSDCDLRYPGNAVKPYQGYTGLSND